MRNNSCTPCWARQPRRATSLERLAHALAAEPDGPDERAFNTDIAQIGHDALLAERRKLHLAIALADCSRWRRERLARIEAELRARERLVIEALRRRRAA